MTPDQDKAHSANLTVVTCLSEVLRECHLALFLDICYGMALSLHPRVVTL
jgi:hypothetical protein